MTVSGSGYAPNGKIGEGQRIHSSYTKDNLWRNDGLLKIDVDWMSHQGCRKTGRGLESNGEW